jgi:hypothetical protein
MARLADGATPQFRLGRDYSAAGFFLDAGLPSYYMLGRDNSAAGFFLDAGLPSYHMLGRDNSAAGVFFGALDCRATTAPLQTSLSVARVRTLRDKRENNVLAS